MSPSSDHGAGSPDSLRPGYQKRHESIPLASGRRIPSRTSCRPLPVDKLSEAKVDK